MQVRFFEALQTLCGDEIDARGAVLLLSPERHFFEWRGGVGGSCDDAPPARQLSTLVCGKQECDRLISQQEGRLYSEQVRWHARKMHRCSN